MRYLLDTCVLSELQKPTGSVLVKEYVGRIPDDNLYVSAVSLGEISKGIHLLPSSARKSGLLQWLSAMENDFSEHILPLDHEGCLRWGELTAKAQKRGLVVHACDGLIAACALQHGLTVLTRNVKDFAPTGVQLYNPWD